MNTNERCAHTPGTGREASSLFFTKAPGEDHYKVYARYPNDPSWIPVQVAWPATPDLQQVRDADRNIATDSGSYEDAHIYLRSADGNNMTTAFFSNADGGGIQSGNANGFSPLNLQPDGGALTYGNEEVATKDWTETNAIRNELVARQTGDFNISGSGIAGTSLSVQGSYEDGAVFLSPHKIEIGRGGNGFTLVDFQGAHVGTVINSMLTAPLKFRYHNDYNQQMVFDTNLRIGVIDGTNGTGERLQVNGSIKQTAVTGSVLKADTDGKIVAAVPGTDYATPTGLTKQIVTSGGFAGEHTVGSKDSRGNNLTPQQYGQVQTVGGVSFEFKESVGDMGLPLNTSGHLALQTMTQWGAGGGGGGVHQLAFNNNDGMYWRFGASNGTAWEPWRKLALAGGNDFIDNQYDSWQNANFKLTGNGYVAGRLLAGDDNGVSKVCIGDVAGGNRNSITLGSAAGSSLAILGTYGVYGTYMGVNTVTGDGWLQQGRTDTNPYAYNFIMQAAGGGVGIGDSPGTSKFKVAGTTFLNGGVDIGDNVYTDPTVALSVKSNREFLFAAFNNGAGVAMCIRQNGNTAIGNINNPLEKLHVQGSIRQSGVTSSVLKANADGKIVAATPGTDFAMIRRGSATFTGDGTTKVFTIPHGLGAVPGSVSMTPKSQLGNKMWFDGNGHVSAVDATNLTITFTVAPGSGANCEYWWVAYE